MFREFRWANTTITMNAKTLNTYRSIYSWAEKAQRPGGAFDWFAIDTDDRVLSKNADDRLREG